MENLEKINLLNKVQCTLVTSENKNLEHLCQECKSPFEGGLEMLDAIENAVSYFVCNECLIKHFSNLFDCQINGTTTENYSQHKKCHCCDEDSQIITFFWDNPSSICWNQSDYCDCCYFVSNASLCMSCLGQMVWSPENHFKFPSKFRERVEIFVMWLKRKRQIDPTKRIPKFLIWEIVKMAI